MIHRTLDHIRQWWRYPQPTWFQRQMGQYTDVIDYDVTACRLASESSAEYALAHMRTCPNFTRDYLLHEYVSQHVGAGTVAEFGVATGRTLRNWAHFLPDRRIWGFDSFDGLPEDWCSRMPAGTFRQTPPVVPGRCHLVSGAFENTLPSWIQANPEPMALLHIDSDLYSSACTVLQLLEPQIHVNTIIVFDEYINYPGWQQDEHRAWQEFVQQHQIQYEYMARVSRHQQVAVRVVARA